MMGLLRRFEKRLERLFEEPFTRAFKGGLHPLEVARRLVREVDDARMLGVSGTLAPNRFLVRLSPPDHARLSGVAASLEEELEALVITYANRKGYHLITRPEVVFEPDDTLREGELSVLASLDEPVMEEPRARAAERWQPPHEGLLGVLTFAGGESAATEYGLEAARTRIGRAAENDVVLADPRASRFHAEIERTPAGYVVRDLGSTNGTYVGGRKVSERLLNDGDTILMGGTEMLFRVVPGQPGR